MRKYAALFCGCLLIAALLAPPTFCFCADNWAPIPDNELKLKSVPGHAGASAILLLHDSYTDNVADYGTEYYRIKILTEAGKKYADVEIPFVKNALDISQLKARTVQEDGTAREFNGQVFDKMIAKRGGIKVQAKVFALPDAQVGTIIEYKYRLRWPPSLPSTRWQLQHDLFTLHAHFALKPYRERPMAWITYRLPADAQPKDQKGLIEYEIDNVPPLLSEDYMPPVNEESMHVDFFYRENQVSADTYWKTLGKRLYDSYEQFVGNRKGIQAAATLMTAGEEAADKKLQKLYAEVQKLRNLSLQREMTEKEQERENLKESQNVEDVLKNGYGYPRELNLLFVALSRAAGIDSYLIRVSERDDGVFHANVPDAGQLTSTLVIATLNGNQVFLDPGTAFCPYGLIPWQKTDVGGLRPTRDGGEIMQTPGTITRASTTERRADLELTENGVLRGTINVTYGGHEALRARQNACQSDDTERKKDLEDDVKDWLSQGATVKMTKVGNWEASDFTLQASFEIEIPGFGAATGRRWIASLAIFDPGFARTFRYANRVHPVYFNTAFAEQDVIVVRLPAGLKVESLPEAQKLESAFGTFQRIYDQKNNAVRLQRVLMVNGYYFPTPRYSDVRNFFTTMKTHDDEPVIMQAGGN